MKFSASVLCGISLLSSVFAQQSVSIFAGSGTRRTLQVFQQSVENDFGIDTGVTIVSTGQTTFQNNTFYEQKFFNLRTFPCVSASVKRFTNQLTAYPSIVLADDAFKVDFTSNATAIAFPYLYFYSENGVREGMQWDEVAESFNLCQNSLISSIIWDIGYKIDQKQDAFGANYVEVSRCGQWVNRGKLCLTASVGSDTYTKDKGATWLKPAELRIDQNFISYTQNIDALPALLGIVYSSPDAKVLVTPWVRYFNESTTEFNVSAAKQQIGFMPAMQIDMMGNSSGYFQWEKSYSLRDVNGTLQDNNQVHVQLLHSTAVSVWYDLNLTNGNSLFGEGVATRSVVMFSFVNQQNLTMTGIQSFSFCGPSLGIASIGQLAELEDKTDQFTNSAVSPITSPFLMLFLAVIACMAV